MESPALSRARLPARQSSGIAPLTQRPSSRPSSPAPTGAEVPIEDQRVCDRCALRAPIVTGEWTSRQVDGASFLVWLCSGCK